MTLHRINDGNQYSAEVTVPLYQERTNQNVTIYLVASNFDQAHNLVRKEYPDCTIHKINKIGHYWMHHVLIVDDEVFND